MMLPLLDALGERLDDLSGRLDAADGEEKGDRATRALWARGFPLRQRSTFTCGDAVETRMISTGPSCVDDGHRRDGAGMLTMMALSRQIHREVVWPVPLLTWSWLGALFYLLLFTGVTEAGRWVRGWSRALRGLSPPADLCG